MEQIMAQKKAMRQEILAKRLNLTDLETQKLSQSLIAKLWELDPINRASSIMAFSSIKNEVNLLAFIEQARKENKRILLPRIGVAGELEAVEFTGWDHIIRGQFGIKEPVGQPIRLEEIDVVLVPGLVFDAKGYRLGYGKGYYDRFLPQLRPEAFKCGVCYEFQVVDDVFPHEKDIPVHWIVTDKSELVIDWDYF